MDRADGSSGRESHFGDEGGEVFTASTRLHVFHTPGWHGLFVRKQASWSAALRRACCHRLEVGLAEPETIDRNLHKKQRCTTDLPSSARIFTAHGSVAISSRPSPGICGACRFRVPVYRKLAQACQLRGAAAGRDGPGQPQPS